MKLAVGFVAKKMYCSEDSERGLIRLPSCSYDYAGEFSIMTNMPLERSGEDRKITLGENHVMHMEVMINYT